MTIFLDSSSLLKLYHQEQNTDNLLNLISKGVESIFLSEIAKIEFCSAIWKKVRTNEINLSKAKEKIAFFQNDFLKYQWIEINEKLINLANYYLSKYRSEEHTSELQSQR